MRGRTTAGLARAVRSSPLGKRMPRALYVHRSAWDKLDDALASCLGAARLVLSPRWRRKGMEPNVVKFDSAGARVTFACYESFQDHPHPVLLYTFTYGLLSQATKERDYRRAANAPILHRKELFTHPEHPALPQWKALTQAEEDAGLYQDTTRIGFRLPWEALLRFKGLRIEDHTLLADREG